MRFTCIRYSAMVPESKLNGVGRSPSFGRFNGGGMLIESAVTVTLVTLLR